MKCLLNKPKYAGIGLAMLVLILSLNLVRGVNVSANPVVTVSVGSGPSGVAVDAATNEIYVANNVGKNVSVISAGLTNITDSISPSEYDIVGASATHNCFYSRRCYPIRWQN